MPSKLELAIVGALCIVLAIIMGGMADYAADRMACNGTRNPAMCELSLQAGSSVPHAVDAGNGEA